MPYIPLKENLPGITGLLDYRTDTALPIRQLTQIPVSYTHLDVYKRQALRDRVFTKLEVAIVAGPVGNRVGEFGRFDVWDPDVVDVGILADTLLFQLRKKSIQTAVVGREKKIFVVKSISQLHRDIWQ